MKKLVFLLLLISACVVFAQKNTAKGGAKVAKAAKTTKNTEHSLDSIKGVFKDLRDKKQYKTIKLGGRVWFAEDLNFDTPKGKLYDFESLKKACPAGWRLPSSSAWEDLKKEIGAADAKLKSQIGWATQGKWWAATNSSIDTTVYYTVVNSGFGGIKKIDDVSSVNLAVRCIQNIRAKPSEKKNEIRQYKTVKIGSQLWMAENLNFKTGKSWCFENDDYYCNTLGRLYDWNTAVKACPAGWHLPTRREWNELTQNADILDTASGFNAVLGGYIGGEFSHSVPVNEYKFIGKETSGNWWGAPEYGTNEAYSRHIKAGEKDVNESVSKKTIGYSVRCVQNIKTNSAKVNNIKQYKTVKVGNNVWMAENLNYKMGKSWCFEDDDFYCNKYGRLYDWSTATKACPAGWHLPSDSEWSELQKTAGKNIVTAIAALQGGWRDNTEQEYTIEKQRSGDKTGRFRDLNESDAWWTSTLFDATGSAQARFLSPSEGISITLKNKPDGLSVRCIQNPPVKKFSKVFTDTRDSKQYGVMKAGKIMWMKNNLGFNAKGSFCYDNKPENCNKYGRLYDWDLAQTVCPAGWRLPTAEDWVELADNSGGNSAGKKLKSKEWNGTDSYGFAALPAGFTKSQGFTDKDEKGMWWTSESNGPFGKHSYMSTGKDEVVHTETVKAMGISVRCVMDCGLFNCVVE